MSHQPRAQPSPIRRVLLVGMMGSGKTRVGGLLAKALGWAFRDFDEEISSKVGLPIGEIFREHGEAFFREMEERTGTELLREDGVVLASGGGWPAAKGRMDDLPPGTLSVWLKVLPREAVRRARKEGPTRPLLVVPDPEARIRELLEEREEEYAKAELSLDTAQCGPEELARQIKGFMTGPGRGYAPPGTPAV